MSGPWKNPQRNSHIEPNRVKQAVNQHSPSVSLLRPLPVFSDWLEASPAGCLHVPTSSVPRSLTSSWSATLTSKPGTPGGPAGPSSPWSRTQEERQRRKLSGILGEPVLRGGKGAECVESSQVGGAPGSESVPTGGRCRNWCAPVSPEWISSMTGLS